ncbi:MAG: hypothetical protein AMJ79_10295 [Phycisphaerae bacterium SM23_30]|nr:MAG: hypothetical protein AMJ79_10295 [Phycisphaerae bacterium SM23_30]
MFILDRSFFRRYLLPGFVFQSVIIGGGYGTGRELGEFFLQYGVLGGLLGMVLITTVMWSVFLALTFEFSRLFRAFDYRAFFKQLLGPGWIIFEEIYAIYLLLVLAVIGAASGELFQDYFNLPYMQGVVLMLAAVGILTFIGSGLIEKFLSIWSFVLYGIYTVFLVVTLMKLGSVVQENFARSEIKPGWAVSGFKYAFYNLANVMGVLFCLRHLQTRKQAVSAGLMAGVIGIVPALLFYIPLVGYYPAVVEQAVPSAFVFRESGIKVLFIIFQIILFGTLIETGTALIHAVNERIHAALQAQERRLPRWLRPAIAIVFLLIAVAASRFGLKDLIAKGYGTICWGFFFVFLLPLANWWLYRMIKSRSAAQTGAKT